MKDATAANETFNLSDSWSGEGKDGRYPRTQKKLGVPVHIMDTVPAARYDTEQHITIGDGNVTIIYDRVIIENYDGSTPWKKLQRVIIHPRVAEKAKDTWLEHRLYEVVQYHLASYMLFNNRRF